LDFTKVYWEFGKMRSESKARDVTEEEYGGTMLLKCSKSK